MSILLAAATDTCAVLCTDQQHTNMRTKEKADIKAPKIETFLNRFGIAHCGSAYTTVMCMKALFSIGERADVSFDSVENVAVFLKEIYSCFIERDAETESKCTSVFVVAGQLKNGHPGLAIISNDGTVDYRVIDGTIDSKIKVFPPADMSHEDCVHIVNQSVAMTQCLSKKKYIPEKIRFEKVLRKSVQLVAAKSHYVSKESTFWIYPR